MSVNSRSLSPVYGVVVGAQHGRNGAEEQLPEAMVMLVSRTGYCEVATGSDRRDDEGRGGQCCTKGQAGVTKRCSVERATQVLRQAQLGRQP